MRSHMIDFSVYAASSWVWQRAWGFSLVLLASHAIQGAQVCLQVSWSLETVWDVNVAYDEQLSSQMQRRNMTLRLPHQGIGREMTLFSEKDHKKPTCEVPSDIGKHVWYIVDMQEFLTRWNDVEPPIKLFKKWKSLILHILPDFILCGACKVWCLEFLEINREAWWCSVTFWWRGGKWKLE